MSRSKCSGNGSTGAKATARSLSSSSLLLLLLLLLVSPPLLLSLNLSPVNIPRGGRSGSRRRGRDVTDPLRLAGTTERRTAAAASAAIGRE